MGDLVEVIDETSFWYHAHGRIVDLTRAGLIVVEIEGLRCSFDPFQLDDATEFPKWPEAA
ncbi:MAG TPA: hypothetical protein VI172_04010 [Candidatus Dormibacteraeota bacterium]|jgi:hypothetical protein